MPDTDSLHTVLQLSSQGLLYDYNSLFYYLFSKAPASSFFYFRSSNSGAVVIAPFCVIHSQNGDRSAESDLPQQKEAKVR